MSRNLHKQINLYLLQCNYYSIFKITSGEYMKDISQSLSDGAYEISKVREKMNQGIPFIGENLVKADKFVCDSLITPLNPTNITGGCDAVNEAYHGLSISSPQSNGLERR
jgi:hypothetical protein